MRVLAIFLLSLWCGARAIGAQPGITLDAATDHAFHREAADNQVYLEARITVPRPATAASTRNVVLVLDRSGSMAGESIAELRRGAMTAIEALAEGDFVAVVLFGSEIETLVEAQRRDQINDLAARIARIAPAGGAALYDGLNQAAAQVRRNAGPATVNQIILVTDGPPTKGPREADDLTRLGEVFAREGIRISTIGLGPDFDEDTLAAMARIGHGRFRYVARPEQLAAVMRAEVAAPAVVVGTDATLTVEFSRVTRKIRSHGWRSPVIEDRKLTWQIPRLLSDDALGILASAEISSFHARFEIPDFATVTLRWRDSDTGETGELKRAVPVQFSRDSTDIRESLNPSVARAGAAVLIRDGLQHAIEQLDKGDPRRALRVIRNARGEARDLNFDLEDAEIIEMVRRLDAYLAGRGGPEQPLERKVLRSGLTGVFDPPAEIVEPKN